MLLSCTRFHIVLAETPVPLKVNTISLFVILHSALEVDFDTNSMYAVVLLLFCTIAIANKPLLAVKLPLIHRKIRKRTT